MAYQTGSYSNQNDLLNIFAAFAVAQGWTQNDLSDDSEKYTGDTFTGRRLHIQKTINGTTAYFNFRSCSNQKVFEYVSYADVTGICVNGSTAYSGGTYWDKQTGYTEHYNSTSSDGGCLHHILESGGTYYLFATDTTLSLVAEVNSDHNDTVQMTVGVTSMGYPFYVSSGGWLDTSDNGYLRAMYLSSVDSGTGSSAVAAYSLFDGTRWLSAETRGYGNEQYRLSPQVKVTASTDQMRGSLAEAYLEYSPDPIRGNAPLPPAIMVMQGAIADVYKYAGTIEGVTFINTTNYSDGSEITIGADTYKVFTIGKDFGTSNTAPRGVAFKK